MSYPDPVAVKKRSVIEIPRTYGDTKVQLVDIKIPLVVYVVEGLKAGVGLALAAALITFVISVIGALFG